MNHSMTLDCQDALQKNRSNLLLQTPQLQESEGKSVVKLYFHLIFHPLNTGHEVVIGIE
jgi:hypothetical protein